MLEANTIKMGLMKEKIMKEYWQRVKKVLGSKLNGGNTIKAINAWAISVVRYSGRIVDWTVDELKEADRKTRKLLTLNGALHPRSNTNRLYLPRAEGGRGLISIRECIRQDEHGLSDDLISIRECIRQDEHGLSDYLISIRECIRQDEHGLSDYLISIRECIRQDEHGLSDYLISIRECIR